MVVFPQEPVKAIFFFKLNLLKYNLAKSPKEETVSATAIIILSPYLDMSLFSKKSQETKAQ